MLAVIECNECDTTLFTARFSIPDFITMKLLVHIAEEHYQLTGHTMEKVVISFTIKELKGDMNDV